MRTNATSCRIICIRLNFIKQLTGFKCKNQEFFGRSDSQPVRIHLSIHRVIKLYKIKWPFDASNIIMLNTMSCNYLFDGWLFIRRVYFGILYVFTSKPWIKLNLRDLLIFNVKTKIYWFSQRIFRIFFVDMRKRKNVYTFLRNQYSKEAAFKVFKGRFSSKQP